MLLLRQYLHFYNSKASKLSTFEAPLLLLRQYLYFCTSKASKLSTCELVRSVTVSAALLGCSVRICTFFVPVKQVN